VVFGVSSVARWEQYKQRPVSAKADVDPCGRVAGDASCLAEFDEVEVRPGDPDRRACLFERQLQGLSTLTNCLPEYRLPPAYARHPVGLRNICCDLDNI
jgi:hypothetical protein